MKEKYITETFLRSGTTWIGVNKANGFYHSCFPASEHTYGKIKSIKVIGDDRLKIQGEKGYEIRTFHGGIIQINDVKFTYE